MAEVTVTVADAKIAEFKTLTGESVSATALQEVLEMAHEILITDAYKDGSAIKALKRFWREGSTTHYQ